MVCERNEFDSFQDQEGRNSLRITDDVEGYEAVKSHFLENRIWSWNHMKKSLKTRNLEELYSRYRRILHQDYFTVFLLLQIVFTVIHVACLIAVEIDDPQHRTLPDIILYVTTTLILWALVAVVFEKQFVKKYPSLPHTVSCLAIALVVMTDIALPIYHTSLYHSRIPLRPAYATHSLLACYIFLPLNNNLTPIILGFGITLCHILTLLMVTYANSTIAKSEIASEVIFFLCVNGMGFYYRLIHEMVIRRAFLDRRACIEFTMKLNYEKEQEEQLLLSILPWHIAARVREDVRRKSLQLNKGERPLIEKPFKELYIEKHDNVSILYADVVNYTKMTSSLPVNKLVETLNELFGKFDEASEKHKVLRIKFLGDCYYCASGIPQPNQDHAKCCVDLALDMIAIIKEIRRERKLDIDMRIGVHSGSILSGLLGKCKWQYDLWSKDVVIANRMEQTGKPGMVHVSKQTMDQLKGDYCIEQGDGHLRDELLAKYKIETFLIRPQEEEIKEVRKMSKYVKKESVTPGKNRVKSPVAKHGADVMYSLQGVISGEGSMAFSRRRAAFMNNNLIMYQQRLKMADVYMEKAIDNLPLGKYGVFSSLWFQNVRLNPFCLTFRGKGNWEIPFANQPDPLFKFYVIAALFVFFCMLTMLLIGSSRLYPISWVELAISTTGLICLLPLTWTHFLWNTIKDPKCQMEDIPKPKTKILLFFYKSSEKIIWSCYLRVFLYFVVCFLLTSFTLVHVINHVYDKYYFANKTSKSTYCGHSLWQMTECCYLAVLVNFLFMRIHFQLKLTVGLIIVSLYSCSIIFFELEIPVQETWNPKLEPKISHILSLIFLVIGLHLMNRQAECINRLDYLWKLQLVNEKDEAEKTRSVNLMLLYNILPIHVAKVYLNTNRASNDLYHENYDCIGVMFASLINYYPYHEKDSEELEIKSLEILNKVICDFDDTLFERKFKTIEKIKVAGSTYMAACGLHPGQRNAETLSGLSSAQILLTLTEFAASVMRKLQNINREFETDFKLRVGIAHGPVTAGVVGSLKPLYDIWGNTVNVASRMDSTGEPGKIQVTASTARLLQEEGILCSFRGPTLVKGKGVIDTYFINLTDKLYVKRKIEEP